MSRRVNPETLLCFAHDIPGCCMCMVDDFHDWIDEQKERRRATRAEARATTVSEKFDLGGEG